MTKTFFEYVQPTLWLCNLYGYTYITARECGGLLRKSLELCLPLPLLVLSGYIVSNLAIIDTTADKRYYYFPKLTRVSDMVSVGTGTLCMMVKLTYYRLYRYRIRDIILQVLSGSMR